MIKYITGIPVAVSVVAIWIIILSILIIPFAMSQNEYLQMKKPLSKSINK